MCDPAPAVAHAKANTSLAANGTVIAYTCEPGYTFRYGMREVYSHCDGVAWTDVETSCEGE